jgi:hypothetical protein
MDDPTKKGFERRLRGQALDKTLGVTREQLQKAIDKVGSSAAAVRRELAA